MAYKEEKISKTRHYIIFLFIDIIILEETLMKNAMQFTFYLRYFEKTQDASARIFKNISAETRYHMLNELMQWHISDTHEDKTC
ncbi:glucose uptake inhibitor SgrT [Sodalis sp. RH19]|uniref:glucose uptake inhibitor SgrT n=1 Tax=Sodalis sp. RH19 TaxID=3394334 RepID=UPI0039B3DD6D